MLVIVLYREQQVLIHTQNHLQNCDEKVKTIVNIETQVPFNSEKQINF